MWYAAKKQPNSKNHIVAFTDADLSTHLGQTMLLINPVLNHSKLASIGSRREENSVVVKKGKRNDRGKLFIYLWKQLIPELKKHYRYTMRIQSFQWQHCKRINIEYVRAEICFRYRTAHQNHKN
jgi:hypothetical protein